MSEAKAVDIAQRWAKWMVQKETKGPGDTENAMRRLANRYGLTYSFLWSLRYRAPKDLLVSQFEKLGNAYEAERQRQLQLLEKERALTEPQSVLAGLFAGAAAALVCEDDRRDEDVEP